jgi:hypothetical protein
MGRGARVTSVDAVQAMAVAIERFNADARGALDDLQMEIRRVLEWIHHDRREFWSQAVRRGWEQVSEARVQLHQAITARTIGDHQPSCVDEKKTLERAKRRLDVALEKVEAVRHWSGAIDHAVNEYRASCSQLANWLDADVPRALASLRQITATLESYLALATPPDMTAAWTESLASPLPRGEGCDDSSPLPPGEGQGEGGSPSAPVSETGTPQPTAEPSPPAPLPEGEGRGNSSPLTEGEGGDGTQGTAP